MSALFSAFSTTKRTLASASSAADAAAARDSALQRTVASDRPAPRAHVGFGLLLLGALLVVALLLPAASAVPARRAQRRHVRSAVVSPISSGSSTDSHNPQLRLFGRCRQSRNGVLEWATFCLACGLESGTVIVYNECCEADKFAETVQFCRDYTPVQYHPHESQFPAPSPATPRPAS